MMQVGVVLWEQPDDDVLVIVRGRGRVSEAGVGGQSILGVVAGAVAEHNIVSIAVDSAVDELVAWSAGKGGGQ